MKKILVTIFVISGLLQTACRKHVPAQPAQPVQPAPADTNKTDTPKVSDSKYNNATFALLRVQEIFRFDTKPDSIQHGVYTWAQFSDSTTPDYYQYTVGRVLLSGIDLGNPIFRGGGQWQYYGAFDMNSYPHLLDTPRFQVISTNRVTDLDYITNDQLYYLDTMPRVIKRNQGLTIQVNPTVAPNTDSVTLSIDLNSVYISVSASVNAGAITLSPTQLAGLAPENAWRTRISIDLGRDYKVTNNGRGYNIGVDRRVYWHVNVE